MSFKITTTPPFERELKKLSKRHIFIKPDLAHLISLLKEDTALGKPLGNNCLKSGWQYLQKAEENLAARD